MRKILNHRSVYGLTKMSVDNVWIQSQNKAVKAGRLLGEVLEKRVQGQRPVILVSRQLAFGCKKIPDTKVAQSVDWPKPGCTDRLSCVDVPGFVAEWSCLASYRGLGVSNLFAIFSL